MGKGEWGCGLNYFYSRQTLLLSRDAASNRNLKNALRRQNLKMATELSLLQKTEINVGAVYLVTTKLELQSMKYKDI